MLIRDFGDRGVGPIGTMICQAATDTETLFIPMGCEGCLRAICLHRLAYEPVEFDVVDVRSCLPTHEVQVFAVAFSAVAKSQCGAALKNDMAKHPCIRQRRQQMKMNRLLD